jgi:hypothetical protein
VTIFLNWFYYINLKNHGPKMWPYICTLNMYPKLLIAAK